MMKRLVIAGVVVLGFFITTSFAATNDSAVAKDPAERLPTVALMVWDGVGKEASNHAELRLYQTGRIAAGLKVSYEITGTARNGYDYTNVNSFAVMKNDPTKELFDYGFDYTLIDPKITVHVSTPIMIDPIDDRELEGDETVVITLLDSPDYKIDPKYASQTVVIEDEVDQADVLSDKLQRQKQYVELMQSLGV